MWGFAEPTEEYFSIGVVVVATILSGLSSGLNLAYFSLDMTAVCSLAVGTNKEKAAQAKKVLVVLQHPYWLLVTTLLFDVVASEVLAVTLESLAGPAVAIPVTVATLLVFGEIIPQALFISRALSVCAMFSGPMYVLMILTAPLTLIVSLLLDTFVGHREAVFYRRCELRELIMCHEVGYNYQNNNDNDNNGDNNHHAITYIDHDTHKKNPQLLIGNGGGGYGSVAATPIASYNEHRNGGGHQQQYQQQHNHNAQHEDEYLDDDDVDEAIGGVLDKSEIRLMMGALSLSESTVKSVMRTRMIGGEAFCVDYDAVVNKELVERVFLSGKSRIPVFKGNNKSNCTHYLIAKTLILFAYKKESSPPSTVYVRDLHLVPARYIQEDEMLGEAYQILTSQPIHMLFVTKNKIPTANAMMNANGGHPSLLLAAPPALRQRADGSYSLPPSSYSTTTETTSRSSSVDNAPLLNNNKNHSGKNNKNTGVVSSVVTTDDETPSSAAEPPFVPIVVGLITTRDVLERIHNAKFVDESDLGHNKKPMQMFIKSCWEDTRASKRQSFASVRRSYNHRAGMPSRCSQLPIVVLPPNSANYSCAASPYPSRRGTLQLPPRVSAVHGGYYGSSANPSSARPGMGSRRSEQNGGGGGGGGLPNSSSTVGGAAAAAGGAGNNSKTGFLSPLSSQRATSEGATAKKTANKTASGNSKQTSAAAAAIAINNSEGEGAAHTVAVSSPPISGGRSYMATMDSDDDVATNNNISTTIGNALTSSGRKIVSRTTSMTKKVRSALSSTAASPTAAKGGDGYAASAAPAPSTPTRPLVDNEQQNNDNSNSTYSAPQMDHAVLSLLSAGSLVHHHQHDADGDHDN